MVGSEIKAQWGSENNYAYKTIVTGYPYQFTNPIAGKTGTTPKPIRWMVYGDCT